MADMTDERRQYPPPPPDINFDQVIRLPGTKVYTKDEDRAKAVGAEDLSRLRAEKKRRIEAHAHAYLRGEGIFIQSAAFRGPFNDGWENPWAAQSKKRKHEAVLEESAVDRARRLLHRERTVTRAWSRSKLREEERGSQTPWKSNPEGRMRPLTRIAPDKEAQHKIEEQTVSKEKVQTWLHRTPKLHEYPSIEEPSSPTPKRQTLPADGPQSRKRDWTPTKQVIAVSSQDVKAPIQRPSLRVAESFETIVPHGKGNEEPADTHARLQIALEEDSPKAADTVVGPRRTAEKRANDSDRAESAIKRMKRRELSPNLQHVGLEKLRRMKDRSEVKLKMLEASIEQQLRDNKLKQMPVFDAAPAAQSHSSTSAILPPSNAPSEARSADLAPSAQARPELHTSASNISSSLLIPGTAQHIPDQFLPPRVPKRKDSDACDKPEPIVLVPSSPIEDDHRHKAKTFAQREATSNPLLDDSIDVIPSSQDFDEPSNRHAPLVPTDATPQVVNSISVLNPGHTGSDIPITKVAAPSWRLKAPNSKRKSASFATGAAPTSYNGSIKNALKVQKAGSAAHSSSHKISPPPKFSEPEIDMDTSIEQIDSSHSPPPGLLLSRISRKRPTKSIIKRPSTSITDVDSSSERPSPQPSGNVIDTTDSRSKLLISGQNGVVQGVQDGFEIKDAIYDMGSFLSTWDAEKNGARVL